MSAKLSRVGGRRARNRGRNRFLAEVLEARTLLATVMWAPDGGGLWTVASNWSSGAVPGPTDDVVIDRPSHAYTITIDSGTQSVHSLKATDSLVLAGGSLAIATASETDNGFTIGNGTTLSVNGPLAAKGSTSWSGGLINGSGSLANSGTLTLPGGADTVLETTLQNNGTIDQAGTGTLHVNPSGTIANQAGGIYEFQSDAGIADYYGAGSISNAGTLRKAGSTGTSRISIPFSNAAAGMIDVQSGNLTLAGGGASHGGTLTVAAQSTLDLTGGQTNTLGGSYTGSGAGTLALPGGTLNIDSKAGAMFNFPAGLFHWTGGFIQNGTLTNAATGVITISGGDVILQAATLGNLGTIAHATASSLHINPSATLINEASAVYDFQADGTIADYYGVGSVSNLGTLRKSAGTGTSAITIPFANAAAAAIDVRTGTLVLAGGGESKGGTFTVAAKATLDLTGGHTNTLAGTYTGSGGGVVAVTGGTVFIDSNTGATFNFPAGLFQWTGGFIQNGTLTNAATGVITVSGVDVVLRVATLDNLGVIDQTTTSAFRINPTSALINEASAVYDFQADGNIADYYGPGGISNLGTFRKSGGTGTSAINIGFANAAAGVIDVRMGTLTLAGAGESQGGTFTVAAKATLDLTGGNSNTLAGTYSGSGSGTVAVSGGTLNIDSKAGATWNFAPGLFQWTGGVINGGTLTNAATGFVSLSGGDVILTAATIQNFGTIAQTVANTLHINPSSILVNEESGLYDFRTDGNVNDYYGPGSINNLGTVRKSGGTASTSINIPITNGSASALDIRSGTLIFNGGGEGHGGSITLDDGAALDLTGGQSYTLQGTYTSTGRGTVMMRGGTLTIDPKGATFGFAAGLFQWTGGIITGGTLTNTGVITLSGQDMILQGIELDNAGTIAHVTTSTLHLNPTAKLVNETAGVYDFRADGNINDYYGAGSIHNLGIFRKSSSNQVSRISIPFQNDTTGVIDVRSGTLVLGGSGESEGGTFNVVKGATLDMTGGQTTTLTGTYTGSGAGTVALASGALAIDSKAAFNFPAGLFQWTGGLIQSGTLTNAATGVMSLSGNDVVLVNATLDNLGTINHTAASTLHLNPGSALINDTSGLYDFQADGGINNYYGAGDVSNLGTFRKSAGTGKSAIRIPFANASAALIDVRTGTMSLAGGGESQGGVLAVAAGAVLDLTGGQTDTLAGTYTGSGGGTVALANGTLAIDSKIGATFDFPAGLFQWTGGAIQGGTLTNAAASMITLPANDVVLINATLDNFGTIDQATASTLHINPNSMLLNEKLGLYDFQADGNINDYYGPGLVRNLGTLRKSRGAGSSSIAVSIDNPGTVEVEAGTVTLSGAVVQDASGILAGGSWSVAAGATLSFPSSGAIGTNNATVILGGPGALFPAIAGLTTNGGNLGLRTGASFTTTGDLTNTGTLTLGGALVVTGGFTQSHGGTLVEQIGGIPTSGLFGSLTSTLHARLDGALDVNDVGGYGTKAGQLFPILTFPALTGNFAIVNGLSIAGAPQFQEQVGPRAINLLGVANAADLAVTGIDPVTSLLFGEPIAVTFTVQNLQPAPTQAGQWVDSVYLSPGLVLDRSAVLLGAVPHSGALAGMAGYRASLTTTVPPIFPGEVHILVVTDSGGAVPDQDRTNNVVASGQSVHVDVPALSAGSPSVGTIAAGQDIYYRFDAPAGRDLNLTVDSAVANQVAFYASRGTLPTPVQHDFGATSLTSLRQQIALLDSQGGTYVLLLHGLTGAGSGQSFGLGTRDLGFEIVSVAPVQGINVGTTAIVLAGSHFSASTTVQLVAPGATINPVSVQLGNSNTLTAAFDLTSAVPGLYDVRINDSGQTFTAPAAFTVEFAQTIHTGALSGNQEWFAGVVHRVSGTVEVPSGVTLTIDPGAIVKFDAFQGITVDSGGTLLVKGTTALPITFTSIKDDDAGGDTDGDGGAQAPAAGDWGIIYLAGNATFNHARLLYGGGSPTGSWSGTASIRTTGSAVLSFSNGVVAQSFFDGILDWGGTTTISNSLFVGIDRAISAHPGGIVTVLNSTFDGNRVSLLSHGGSLTASNNVVFGSSQAGYEYDFGPAATLRFNDIDSTVAGAANYVNVSDQTGRNGNISADPKFVDLAHGDYRLHLQSPAINAADGSVGPATDAVSDPRYNDPRTPDTGIADASGHFPDMGAFEFVEMAPSNIALAAANVVAPLGVLAGQPATITWEDVEAGSVPASGPWHDTINLVLNPGPNQSTVPVASVLVAPSVTLGPAQTLSLSAEVMVPPTVPGAYFWQVVADGTGDVFEGANRSAGGALTAVTTAVALPVLAAGATAATGQFTAPGQLFAYQVAAAAGQDTLLALQAHSAGSGVELYAARGYIPDPTHFDQKSGQFNAATARLVLAGTSTAPYYVTAYARALDSAAVGYTLGATIPSFSLVSASPGQAGNAGQVTIEVVGGQLRSNDAYQLVGGRVTITASRVNALDSTRVLTTFDLGGAPAGSYDLVVTRAGVAPLTLPKAVAVVAPMAAGFNIQLALPPAYRIGKTFSGQLVYRNDGNSDLAAPLLIVSAAGQAEFGLDPSGSDLSNSDLVLVAAGLEWDAGVLRPGQQWGIRFKGLSAASSGLDVSVSYKTADATDPIDYVALGPQIRPPALSDADWNRLYPVFQAEAGPTYGGFVKLMDKFATLQAQQGSAFVSLRDVLGAALADALRQAETTVSGTLFVGDTAHPLGNVQLLLDHFDNTQPTGGTTAEGFAFSDGTFQFYNVQPGTYQIVAPGYFQSVPAMVTVPASGGVSGLSVVVQGGGAMAGTVRDGFKGVPLPGIDVIATSDSGVFSTQTDAIGMYTLGGLPPGTYTVAIGGGSLGTVRLAGLAVTDGTQLTGEDAVLAPAASVSGTVSGAGGAVPGAQVILTDSSSVPLGTLTDSGGNFGFGGLAEGTYTLAVLAGGLGTSTHSLHINAGATLSVPINLVAAASLAVTIENASANPVTGRVELLQGSQILGDEFTAADGKASFTGLAAGSYSVVERADGFQQHVDAITLTAGQALTLRPALSPAGVIAGTVADGSGKPIANIGVDLVGKDAAGEQVSTLSTTAPDGSYTIKNVPAGAFSLSVGNGAGIELQPVSIDAAHPLATANFSVAGSVLSGTVVGADGTTPVTKAEVALVEAGELIATAATDASGHYTLRALAAGTYTILAAAATGISAPETLTITANTASTAGTLALGKVAYSGSVVDGSGRPVAGATVVLVPPQGSYLAGYLSTTTGSDGKFALWGLAAGTYTAEVAAPGFSALAAPLTLPSATAGAYQLSRGNRVLGVVSASGGGAAVAQALVQLLDPATHATVAGGRTDAAGQYALGEVPTGTYNAFVISNTYQIFEQIGVVVAGTPTTLNFALAAPGTALQGTVKDGSGHGLAGAEVSVVNGLGETVQALTTNLDGSYATSQLAVGTYSVVAQVLGYHAASVANVAVGAGTPATANIALAAAGTDDAPTLVDFQEYLSNSLGYALSSFDSENNPRPSRAERDHYPPLPPSLCPCADALRQRVLQADRNKEAAYEAWESAFASRNTTAGSALLAATTQLTNLLASIVGAVKSSALGAAFQGAKYAEQLSVSTLQGIQLAQSFSGLVSDFASAVKSGGDPLALVTGLFGDIGSVASNGASTLDLLDKVVTSGIDPISGSPVPGILQGPLNVIANFVGLVSTARQSYLDWKNQSGGTVAAEQNYFKAFYDYESKRRDFIIANGQCNLCNPPPPPPPPPPPNPDPGPHQHVDPKHSVDPNDLTTVGFGPQGYISTSNVITYTIDFENLPAATAPAQRVTITDPLDANLDWSTIELQSIGFNGQSLVVPAGVDAFDATTSVASDPAHPVKVHVALDASKGVVTWSMTSLDPVTLAPTDDPLAGFLPPDDAKQSGEGSVTFLVRPNAGLASGATIHNHATVVFDVNAPLDTPAAVNTLDTTPPSSTVAALPARTRQPNIRLSWSGSDGAGSGIATYDVYSSTDGGPFALYLHATPNTTATFPGAPGHTYGFVSVATDNVGNRQPMPAGSQTTIRVLPTRAIPGDFDGDGIVDPAVFEPSIATFYIARSNLGNEAVQFGIGTQYGGHPINVSADYEGGALIDPAVFEPSTATFYIHTTHGNEAIQFGIGTQYGGHPIPVPGYYEGDNIIDPAVFEPSTSTFYIARHNAPNEAVQFGIGTQYGGHPIPVPNNFEGDGKTDPAVFEPSTSTFYIARHNAPNEAVQFGIGRLYGGNPVVVPNNYEGDGTTDPAVFEPSTSTFYIARHAAPNEAVQFGIGTLYGGHPAVAPADYEGDGNIDPAVFEPSTSTFFIARHNAPNEAVQFGIGSQYGGHPVVSPADFEGDGRIDPAVFEPSTSTFYIARHGAPNEAVQFGIGTQFGGHPVAISSLLSPTSQGEVSIRSFGTVVVDSGRRALPTILARHRAVVHDLALEHLDRLRIGSRHVGASLSGKPRKAIKLLAEARSGVRR